MLIMNSNAIRKRTSLNYYIQHRVYATVLILVTFVLSSYLLPLAYSQEFYYISSQFRTAAVNLSEPEGIAIDPSSGNVYVADTANNRIQVFSSNGTFISKWGTFGGGNGTL